MENDLANNIKNNAFSSDNVEILKRLERIEEDVRATRESLTRMRKYTFWRMIIIIAAILLPAIAIPFFIDNFIKSYLAGIEGLL